MDKELIKISDEFHRTTCYMCQYLKGTKEYEKGRLKMNLCRQCVRKINHILGS